jgi:DNA polymerase-3 subunit epsilon
VDPNLGLVERLFEELAGSNEGAPLGPVACKLFMTSDESAASAILEALVSSDPRFVISGGTIATAPAERPQPDLSLWDAEFAVLDFETNGLAPGERAIELGLACFRGGEEVDHYQTLLNPGTAVAPFVSRLTGIAEEDLARQPGFEEIWPQAKRLMDRRILVAHNLPFDRRVLRDELGRLGQTAGFVAGSLCTLRLARCLLPREEPKSLDALAERFGLAFKSRHRALDDARVAGRLLYKLLDFAVERTPLESWGDLQSFIAPRRRSRRRR